MQTAIQLSPHAGFQKYVALAQLEEGCLARDLYLEACRVLAAATDSTVVRRQLAEIYCSLAELYMTDLCDEEDAEKHCQDYLDRAHQLLPSSLDTLRLQAEFCLCREDAAQANTALEAALKGLQELDRESADYPSYDLRLSLSKLLIELARYGDARQLLEGLLAEDDEVISTWYLLGLCCKMNGDSADAAEALESALRLALKYGDCDPDIAEATVLLLQELQVDVDELRQCLEAEMRANAPDQ